MSDERCLSLDRAKRQQQNVVQSEGYMPERSPYRSPTRTCSPKYSLSTPEIMRDSFHGALPAYSLDEIDLCPTPKRIPRTLELQHEHILEVKEGQRLCSTPRIPQPADLPDEFLEDFAQPSFYEHPANSSFDEMMCILASPPSRVPAPTEPLISHVAAENLVECPQPTDHVVTTEFVSSPALCPYKIPPLPDDPYDIPPHPKDPNDVVGFIRRSRAIHRLKALQEAEAAKQLPKVGTKKGISTAVARRKPSLVPTKRPSGLGKPQIKKATSQPQKPKVVGKKKKDVAPSPQHPPDYIAPEYAAHILQARQLAGLKTRNPKLLPKTQIASPPTQPKAAPRVSPPPPRLTPPPASYASIVERAAAIRAKAKAARAQSDAKADVCSQETGIYVDVSDRPPQLVGSPPYERATAAEFGTSLDEFEELERQFGAACVAEAQEKQAAQFSRNISHDEVGPECIGEAHGKHAEEQCRHLSLDEFEELERQMEAAAEPSLEEFEELERHLEAEAIIRGESHSAAEAYCMRNRIDDLKTKLLSSGEGQLVAEELKKDREYSINELQTQLLDLAETPKTLRKSRAKNIMQEYLVERTSPSRVSPIQASQSEKPSPVFELPPVIRFFDLMRRREELTVEPSAELSPEECMMLEYATDTKQFQDIADWNLADISSTSDVCKTPSSKSPQSSTRVTVPRTSSAKICPSSIDDTPLEAVDMPDFDIEDVAIQEFEDKKDLNFEEDIDLGDVTMPEYEFDEDPTISEFGLEDVSSPELDDLSISVLEGYDPDYPFEKSRDKDLATSPQQQTSPGFLTSVVSAVVDKFRNIFGGTPKDVDGDEDDGSRCINLDSSLPNLFETTPPPRIRPTVESPVTVEGEYIIPEYPKEYLAMIKKSQQIYKQKAKEAAEAAEAAKALKGKKKPPIKSTIPKRAPPSGVHGKQGAHKKQEPPAKIYPPGEYSPSYAAEVARARTLAGYKNRSAILNPERAAKIAAIKAAKEAELAAEEALPPVERMRKRMARLQRKGSRICLRPSVETLGTLEAIRANLPSMKITSLPKPKWRPVPRRRADTRIEDEERVFTKSPIRVFEGFEPMTPLAEESYNEEDLIRFTPLRAREGRLRLKHLKEQAERAHQREVPQDSDICTQTTESIKYSPIRLQSPSRTRAEEWPGDTTAPGEESIREEVTKTSTIENGEVHTSTRKVTTKTDEFGNVSCHVEEATGLTGEDDNIDAIEAPDFLNISDQEAPRDPSIPTPAQIIDRIRQQVQQKLNLVLPELPAVIESPVGRSLERFEFPEDLPDEQLYDIDMPELETTPQQLVPEWRERSPDTSLPHFWHEEKQPTITQPKVTYQPTPVTKVSPVKSQKMDVGPVVIPPCPKDPKDYHGMIMYARALYKRKQQEAEAAAHIPPPVAVDKKPARVPISRRTVKKPGKQLLPKKKSQKIETKQTPKVEEADVEPPTEPPPLPAGYAEEVARARELAGYKNRTAALNPKVAAKLAAKKAAEEAALAEYEALSEYDKILRRMEKIRQIPTQTRCVKPNTDIINMPPTTGVLPSSASPTRQTPICKTVEPEPTIAPKKIQDISRHLSLDEFEALEEHYAAEGIVTAESAKQCRNLSLDEFEELERQLEVEADASLDEFEALEMQMCAAARPYRDASLEVFEGADKRRTNMYPNVSLEEFEALERQLNADAMAEADASRNISLNEFEALERGICPVSKPTDSPKVQSAARENIMQKRITELQNQLLHSGKEQLGTVDINYTRKRMADLQAKLLGSDKPQSPTDAYSMRKEYSMCQRINELQSKLLDSAETPKKYKKPRARNIMQESIIRGDEDRSTKTKTPTYDQAYYQDIIEDLCPVGKQFGTEGQVAFGTLEPQTPVNLKERLRRIKESRQRTCPTVELNAMEEISASPEIDYSPIRLFSPTGERHEYPTPKLSPDQNMNKEVLVDLATPGTEYRVKQFKDLEDMPFDDIEYENEPSFVNTSFDKPLTPPPRPSEVISRIRKQVQEHLRSERSMQEKTVTASTLQLPQQFSEEDLFEMSDPSLAHATLGETTERISARVPSPVRTPTPTSEQVPEVVECSKVPSPVKPVEEMYIPKYPKGYVEMVMKARALHKLKQQQQAEMAAAAPPSEPTKKKAQITKTRPGGKVVMKKGLVRPPKTAKKLEKQPLVQVEEERECPAEPPPLPPDYLADVARARQLAGYKNKTAALNKEVAAAEAAYAALSEHEKIKVRMERLRKKSGRRRRPQLNMEQLAFLQAMKETTAYNSPSRDPSPKTSLPQRRLSITPRPSRIRDMESPDLAEFEALERGLASPKICPRDQPDDLVIEKQALEEMGDVSIAQSAAQLRRQANAQLQQLATPTQLDARERYKRLLSQRQEVPKTPAPVTPVQTPDIHFSPIRFPLSPITPKKGQREEKSTTKITRSGDNTIKEQVIETSEIVNGQLQQVTKHVTTTTDPSGNVSRQINESRQLKDTSVIEDELADIEQPSFLDVTPMSPIDVSRPRDIIERIRRDVESKPRPPYVPTGRLVELRTPPRELPLPHDITEEELLEMSCPTIPKTPTKSPVQSPHRSPVRSPDVSIPQLFVATPEPPTPPLPPVSPLRYRVHSPEGPIVIPPCPTDPTDYKAMVRMSRKIYELKLQKEAEAKAAAEAAAIEAAKPKKKERVPISRWTAPPPKKPTTRKKLVMKKRAPVETKSSPVAQVRECPLEPPPLPEGYAEEVARARQLAGLRNLTAALNPEVAAREAAKVEAAAEVARDALIQEAVREKSADAATPHPVDYKNVISRMAAMRQHGHMAKVQPSHQAAAYLNAVKGAMDVVSSSGTDEPAETRYRRILAARAVSPPHIPEDYMDTTPLPEDVRYTPVVLGSPTAKYVADVGFDMRKLQDIGDLEEIPEPSFLDESQSPISYTERYMPVSPKTPPPSPSAIIRRIRGQVHEKLAAENIVCPMPTETPTPLYFPEDLPDEELFELSAPSFARTPQGQSPARVFTPNISIPQYFEATPRSQKPTPVSPSTHAPKTPPEHLATEVSTSASPPLMGVHPGLRVLTPEGPLVLPPHPKGPESVVDMIRRAQLIHKIKAKEEAAKAAAKVDARKGVRVPISRRLGGPTARTIKKPLGKPKQMEAPQMPVECPAEPPELPPDYIAAVARARRLAGLKNTRALLNPPQDYGTILARVAALKAGRGEIEPTEKELAEAQNIIKRPQRKDVILPDQQQLETPRPAIERYRAYRSRKQRETPTTSKRPYSPVKTPVLDHLPAYRPVCLAPTPPFLQNINMSDIGDTSMPCDLGDTQNTDIGDISMPFDMDDDVVTGQYDDTNLGDISMPFGVNESAYCQRELQYVEPDVSADFYKHRPGDSVVGMDSFKSTESSRCRADRHR